MIDYPDQIESAFPVEKISTKEKIKNIVDDIFVKKETLVDKDALTHPWDEDMCLALKTEIGSKPEKIDVDKIIQEAYEKLNALLGPHAREGITAENIKNRIIFTERDTLTAFRYMYEQPGEDSDKYWKNPHERIHKIRGLEKYFRIVTTGAVSYGLAGLVMIPNNDKKLEDQDDLDIQYIKKHNIDEKTYPELAVKRTIAHEMVHFLYQDRLKSHMALDEPITDYVVSKIFPEVVGVDVRLDWAKASVEEYIKKLGYKTVSELTLPSNDEREQRNSNFDISVVILNKFFSDLGYQNFGLSEEILSKLKKSKYKPIPEY